MQERPFGIDIPMILCFRFWPQKKTSLRKPEDAYDHNESKHCLDKSRHRVVKIALY